METLVDRVAFITGSTSGMGLAIAQRLAEKGPPWFSTPGRPLKRPFVWDLMAPKRTTSRETSLMNIASTR